MRPLGKGARSEEFWIALSALVVRACVCAWAAARVPPTADGGYYHIVAQRIAGGDGYTWLWPDGVVTAAAHYPVGYPAMMSAIYALLGPSPVWIMLQNALIGSWGVWAMGRVMKNELALHFPSTLAKRAARTITWALALSPTLVFYTPALMTEAEVAGLLAILLWVVGELRARPRASLWLLLSFGMAGVVLMRPQCVLLAPVYGLLAVRGQRLAFRSRILFALALSCITVLLVSPWTLRNCQKMERCVFVSANGGWNLLIGTFPEGHGAWVPLDESRVPSACRTVYQEARKDDCFGRVAREKIARDPGAWVSQIPSKLRVTFDYFSPATDHLQEAGALTAGPERVLRWGEYLAQRLFAALGLVGAAALVRRGETRWRRCSALTLAACGLAALLTPASWLSWVALSLLWVLSGRCLLTPAFGLGAACVVSTGLVHAVFFGAGRYAIPALVALSPTAAYGLAYIAVLWDQRRLGGRAVAPRGKSDGW